MPPQVPLPIQTMYAELVERAHTAQMAQDFDPAGRFLKKTIKDRAYWYFRSAMTGSIRRDKYVGIDTPELAERIANHRSDKNDYKQRRTLVAALTRAGLKAPDPRTGRVLEALANAGIFRMRAVVVGTAAYQTYAGLLGVKLANINVMTDDLDLAQFGSISIALDDAVDIPFLNILRTIDPGFNPLPGPFDKARATRFALGNTYRVDVLTPNRGPENAAPVPLPALRTDAQPLRFLDFLIYQEVQAVALYGPGVPINVPAPERFALHKLIVSRLRIATSESQAKVKKDLRQAGELISALATQRPYELKDLWTELTERGPKWKRLASEAATLLDPTPRQHLAALVGPFTQP